MVKHSFLIKIFVAICALVVGFAGTCVGYCYMSKPQNDTFVGNELSFHFLTLGNNNNGDCYYIKCGNVDILVDGGSQTNSIDTIYNYVNNQMTDDVLEYVIITHAHEDHYACYAGDDTHQSLFEKFNITTLIDFSLTNQTETKNSKTTMYGNYVNKRSVAINNGMTHYTAKQCLEETDGAQASYKIGLNTSLNILYNKYYYNTISDENEYSVIFQIVQNDRKFLFTGDLEEKGEKALVEYYSAQANNPLSQVELFKAGHHGSKTSNTTQLFNVINPKICVVSCVAGSTEYTTNDENTFPTQTFIDNISQYTSQVYVTSQWDYTNNKAIDMNGNIVVTSNASGVSLNCSNNNTVLKDTTWFANHRTWPTR